MIFINCTNTKSIGLFKPFFPISIPYGIGYLMAILLKEKSSCHFIDQQTSPDVLKEVKILITKISKPYIFCVSALSEAVPNAVEICKLLKKTYPDAVIICGGLHATIFPEDLLNHAFIDYVFRGEGETSILDIYNCIKEGKSPVLLNGIGYKDSGRIILNTVSSPVCDLDDLPLLPYDLLIKNKSYSLGYIITSRGCPYNCLFCCNNIIGQKTYRYRSPENIIGELDLLVNKYKQNNIAFFDDNFLAKKSRIFELCSLIRREKLNLKSSFGFQSRCRDIDEEILKELHETGFNTVFFGIESVSEHLLKKIGKHETLDQIKSAVIIAKKTGFKVIANFMYCLPDETHEDRMKCVDFSIENNIDIVKFNNLVPYPGTDVYNLYKNSSNFHMYSNYSNTNSQLTLVQPFWKKLVFPFIPSDSTHKEIRNDILFSYLKFYFNLHKIKRILFQKKRDEVLFSINRKNQNIFKKITFLAFLFSDLTIKIINMGFNILTHKIRKLF